jgi:hypothetical protein
MGKENKRPYGYIYQATNVINGKNYEGQTISSRWKDHQIPIEERWKQEVREAYGKEIRGEGLRYIEQAIMKYGPENFKLRELDTAISQADLDAKETYWIREYDSTNHDKGYSLKEGGFRGFIK